MKALTVWQPWASLIAVGAKPYEFRRWKAPDYLIGQRIAIHAGARKIKASECDAIVIQLQNNAWEACMHKKAAIELLVNLSHGGNALPLSAVIATAKLTYCVPANTIVHEFGGPVVNDSDREEHFNFAWRLEDVETEPPVPCRGMQGLWNWSV
jgi:hypothetical protein